LCLAVLALWGCFDPLAAYEDPATVAPGHDQHDPETLARVLLRSPSTVAYSDDGEHFALHRCTEGNDSGRDCDLVFGTRAGVNDVWPVRVPARSLDGAGGRSVVAALARRLGEVRAHLMENERTGRRVVVAAARGGHVVSVEGPVVRLDHARSRDGTGGRTVAAALVRGAAMPSEVRAVASFRRPDAIAVELWLDAERGESARRHNAWVLFFRDEHGRWLAVLVPPRDRRGIYLERRELR
jgi:hypothetical protein